MTGEIWGVTAGKTCYNICRMTMLIWLCITLLACGGGSSAVGAKAPTARNAAIVSVSPADGADQVAVSSVISVTFKSDMDPASLNAETFQVTGPDGAISGDVGYDSATRTATFIPIAPLMPLSSYTAAFTSGIRSQKGSVLTEDYAWKFKTAKDVMERSASDKVTDGLFSLNVINLEWGAAWPTIPFKSWRNSHSAWIRLEPQKGQWTFDQLDNDIALAKQKGVEVMLLLGTTPTWASARPDEDGPTPAYPKGCIAEARDIEDWKNYIRTVATRYKGQIHYYELWNEPDQKMFYSGTIDKLVELSRTAYQILKEVDPTITVASPAMTSPNMTYFDNYLASGGKAFADVIGYHFYVAPKAPEAMLAKIESVRSVMQKYGISKPLWNTETGWKVLNSDKNLNDEEWAGTSLSAMDASAYVARSYILSWTMGVERLYWYAWGHRSMGLTEYDAKTPKAPAFAYSEIRKWLIGAKMISCGQNNIRAWVVQIARDNGYKGWIVWNPDKSLNMELPREWNAKRMKDLNGSVTMISGSKQVSIGPMPVLIEN